MTQPQPENQDKPSWTDYPELRQAVQKDLEKLPDIIERLVLEFVKRGDNTRRYTSLGALLVILGLIIAASILAARGNLSSDALAFLFGVIAGAAFTYLSNILGGGK